MKKFLLCFVGCLVLLVGGGQCFAAAAGWGTSKVAPGAVRVLAQSAAPSSVTGTVNETTLATYTVPAGLMGKNGALRVTVVLTTTNSSNNKTLRMRLGGTIFTTSTITTAATSSEQRVIRNRNSASSQVSLQGGPGSSFNGSSSAVFALTVNTAVAQALTITGQLANTGETITLEGYTIELLPGAN